MASNAAMDSIVDRARTKMMMKGIDFSTVEQEDGEPDDE